MKEQVLSIPQMQELIKLGIDTSKASMCWITYPSLSNKNKRTKELIINNNTQKCYFRIISVIDYATVLEVPTYTIQDILEILPEIENFHLEVHPEDNTLIYVSTYGVYKCLQCYEEKTLLESA